VSRPLKSTALGNQRRRIQNLALGKLRLQVKFSGVYEYKTRQGPLANEGEGSGIATIEGDTAIFKPKKQKRNAKSRHWQQTGHHTSWHLRLWSQCKRHRKLQKISSQKPKFGSD
jgi:hypothetical protein